MEATDDLRSPGKRSRRTDNPSCVNPRCLFLGTDADNRADKIRKGRQSHHSQPGETHGAAILTELIVSEIRAKYVTGLYSQRELGNIFGISQAQICNIVNNKRWKKAE